MNINNANSEFQDLLTSDFGKHWTWSNFYRHLFACNCLLPYCERGDVKIIDLGAGDSKYDVYMRRNFGVDCEIVKYDVDTSYPGVIEHDITQGLREKDGEVDVVIFTEVIEHLDPLNVERVLNEIWRVLKRDGMMIISTPIPKKGLREELVWDESHEHEYSYEELLQLLCKQFKFNKSVYWSQSTAQRLSFLADDDVARAVYARLLDRFPESFVQGVISLLAPECYSRQVIVACTPKRKVCNG